MSLPAAWVDRIFQKLTLTYGRDFTGRWEGFNVDEVKADWAHELAGYVNNPDAIKHALENLPSDKPPTVLQFRDAARKAPIKDRPMLPPPPMDPEKQRQVIASLKQLADQMRVKV